MSKIDEVFKSKAYHEQVKQEMLVTLLRLCPKLAEESQWSVNTDDKIKALCQGYDMILRLMEEVETQETK